MGKTADRIMFDTQAREIFEDSLNMMIPWYLMASYAYYEENDPIISDSLFDEMARKMLESWESLEHMHKSLISCDDLAAGTYMGEYPERVKGAVETVREDYGNVL